MTTATFEENCSTITVDEGNMMRLYTEIDNDMRGYIWGGCDLPSEYEPYREAISDADREIKEIDRQYSDPETGYTPEGERRTEEVISFLCRNLLPLMAKERGYRDPDYVNPSTGSSAPLSEWICDYFDDTPEEWGGKLFSDGGLEEADEDDE